MILSSGPSQRKLVLIESIRVCACADTARIDAATAASATVFMAYAPVCPPQCDAAAAAGSSPPAIGPQRLPLGDAARSMITLGPIAGIDRTSHVLRERHAGTMGNHDGPDLS